MRQLIKNTGLMGMLLILMSSCDSDRVITNDELPAQATAYIQTHFAEHGILQATKERDGFSVNYDVMLQDGYQLEFDSDGEIKKIDGSAKLPDSTVPAPISDYVGANFPQVDIVEWERSRRGADVKLANGIELEFDKDGRFLRIDQ